MNTLRHLTPTNPHQRGFSLMEMVLVITLMGIVGAMVSGFMRYPISAYVDAGRRAELTEAADTAMRRIARELQSALPNSVRVNATGRYLEFLPVSAAGRYRAAKSLTGTGDELDFSTPTDDTFEVLGPPVSVAAGDQLVINNLGLTGADAYQGTSRRALVTTGAGLSNLRYNPAGVQFPFGSPSNRFFIVSRPVTLACVPSATGYVRRVAGYAIQAAQPVNIAGAPLSGQTGANNALLTPAANPGIHVTACSFSYSSGASTRNGVVTVSLTLTSSLLDHANESITLLQQLHVGSSP